jgi:kynurenine formamidase
MNDLTVDDIPESALTNQNAIKAKSNNALTTLDARTNMSKLHTKDRVLTKTQISQRNRDKDEIDRRKLKMKADQQLALHFKSPDKTTKPRFDKKRESIPMETESSQKSLLDNQ